MPATKQHTMTQAHVACILDLEHRMVRAYGDLREILAIVDRIGGKGVAFMATYDAMRAVARAQDAMDSTFLAAGDLDREAKGEPPF